MAKLPSHVHRLKRYTYKKTGSRIFFCTLPDCHFKIDSALAIGKRSLCNVCGSEFIMSEYTIRLLRPHCINCGKVKVRGSDGKSHYVQKGIKSGPLADMAAENMKGLRSRLDTATSVIERELDGKDDIEL